jgi:hypothetical protein
MGYKRKPGRPKSKHPSNNVLRWQASVQAKKKKCSLLNKEKYKKQKGAANLVMLHASCVTPPKSNLPDEPAVDENGKNGKHCSSACKHVCQSHKSISAYAIHV